MTTEEAESGSAGQEVPVVKYVRREQEFQFDRYIIKFCVPQVTSIRDALNILLHACHSSFCACLHQCMCTRLCMHVPDWMHTHVFSYCR